MTRKIVLVVAVVLGLGVFLASAQQPKRGQQAPDLSGCWTLTASEYYNAQDTVTVPPYDYMQQLLVDPTANHSGTPSQMLPKGGLLPKAVIKFTRVSGDFYMGHYISGGLQSNNHHWLAHVVIGGTPQEPVYYVPMSFTGPTQRNFSPMAIAYIAAYAGIADSNSSTRITGTWVDSRGAMSLGDLKCADQPAPCVNTPNPHDVGLYNIIFRVQTGRYILDKIPGRCPQ